MPLPGLLKGLALEYHLQERLLLPLSKEATSHLHLALGFILFIIVIISH